VAEKSLVAPILEAALILVVALTGWITHQPQVFASLVRQRSRSSKRGRGQRLEPRGIRYRRAVRFGKFVGLNRKPAP
jgi:hypothetical protein